MISLELLAYALNNICKFETLKIAFAHRTHTLKPQPPPPTFAFAFARRSIKGNYTFVEVWY